MMTLLFFPNSFSLYSFSVVAVGQLEGGGGAKGARDAFRGTMGGGIWAGSPKMEGGLMEVRYR